eukprot:4276139-Lingulodinium_polyedra.AAC.1
MHFGAREALLELLIVLDAATVLDEELLACLPSDEGHLLRDALVLADAHEVRQRGAGNGEAVSRLLLEPAVVLFIGVQS